MSISRNDGRAFDQLRSIKVTEDFVASARWLKAHANSTGRLGATGFCFGGGIVNQLAVRLGGDLNAGAPFYGRQPSAEDTAKISAPLMLHYAENDDGGKTGIAAYEEALKANNKKYVKHVYPGTQHAFNNDLGAARYNKAAADDGWNRCQAWFKQYGV